MSGYYDTFDDFLGAWEDDPKPKSKSRKTSKRTTQYVAPGHTRVRYAHRTLNIHFKETEQEFKKRQKARRRAGARKGAKHRTYRPRDNNIYVTTRNGEMIYVDSRGREVSSKARRYMDDGYSEMTGYALKNDRYNVEDMRALLKDAHWDEVCGNKRWSYDSKATVKEFKKYQREYAGMF